MSAAAVALVHVLVQSSDTQAAAEKRSLHSPAGLSLSAKNLQSLVEEHAGEYVADATVASVYDAPNQDSTSYVHTLQLSSVDERLPACCLLVNRLANGHVLHVIGWARLSLIDTTTTATTEKKRPPIVARGQPLDRLHFTIVAGGDDDGRRLVLNKDDSRLSTEWRQFVTVEAFGFVGDHNDDDDGGDTSARPVAAAAAAATTKTDDDAMAVVIDNADGQQERQPVAVVPAPVGVVDAQQLLPRVFKSLAGGLQSAPTIDTLLCLTWLVFPKTRWSRHDLLSLFAELMPVEYRALLPSSTRDTRPPLTSAASMQHLIVLLIEQEVLGSVDRLLRQLPLAPLTNSDNNNNNKDRSAARVLVQFHDVQQRACKWFLPAYQALLYAARLQHKPFDNTLLSCQTPPSLQSTLQEIVARCSDGFGDYLQGAPTRRPASFDTGAIPHIQIDLEIDGDAPPLVDAVYETAPRCLQKLIDVLRQTRHLSHAQMNVLVPAVYHFFRHQPSCSREHAFGRTERWFQQQGVTLLSPSKRLEGTKSDDFCYKAWTLLTKRMMLDSNDKLPAMQLEPSCRSVIGYGAAVDSLVCPFKAEVQTLSTAVKRASTDIEELCLHMCLLDYKKNRKVAIERREGMPSMHWMRASLVSSK